jgi:dipeptidyl-peptidase III
MLTLINPILTLYHADSRRFHADSRRFHADSRQCTGLHLSLYEDILAVFGHAGEAAEDIVYINWLNMVRAGVCGLEFYTPTTAKWRQAHMQDRHVILHAICFQRDVTPF